METKHLKETCDGIKEERIEMFSRQLEEIGVIGKLKDSFSNEDDTDEIAEWLTEELFDRLDECRLLYTLADYVADTREIPFHWAIERIATAIVCDVFDRES